MDFGLQGKVHQDALRFSAEKVVQPPSTADSASDTFQRSLAESPSSPHPLTGVSAQHTSHQTGKLQLDLLTDPHSPSALCSGQWVLGLYRQARFRSFTCASLLVIMVAKTRPKRTLLINT